MRPHSAMLAIAAFLLCTHAAAGFGYLQGSTQTRAAPGDEVHFNLFLSGTNESVKVTETDVPTNWRVNVDRKQVTFPVDSGFRYMETEDGYRRVVPLRITAAISPNATAGRHTIAVTLAGQPAAERKKQAVAVKQVQEIAFTVAVSGENGAESVHSVENKGGATGMTITGRKQDETDAAQDTSSDWKDPVFLLVLFEITWGIAVIYVWKRRNQ